MLLTFTNLCVRTGVIINRPTSASNILMEMNVETMKEPNVQTVCKRNDVSISILFEGQMECAQYIKTFLDICTGFFGSRHVFALMGFLGLAAVYMMRINLSVAIVDMVRTPNTTTFFGRSSSGGSSGNGSEQCENDESGDSEVGILLQKLFEIVNVLVN